MKEPSEQNFEEDFLAGNIDIEFIDRIQQEA